MYSTSFFVSSYLVNVNSNHDSSSVALQTGTADGRSTSNFLGEAMTRCYQLAFVLTRCVSLGRFFSGGFP